MKKTIIILGLIFFGTQTVFAGTSVSFSPKTIETQVGKTFSVTISVNPQGVYNYSEKIQLLYPKDIIEVSSFSMNQSWIPLTQSGYDLIDNSNGVLLKTAGYPSGINSETVFGTVVFKVKKEGSGTISLGSESRAYEIDKESAITGSSVNFVSKKATVAPVVNKKEEQKFVIPESNTSEENSTTTDTTETPSNVNLQAQVSSSNSDTKVYIEIIGGIALFIFGFLFGRKVK